MSEKLSMGGHGMPYRILAMDGASVSGGNGYVAVGMLRALRRMLDSRSEHRALLGQVDLFVGSSAGAVNAALFAREEHPDAALGRIIDFWGELLAMNKDGLSIRRSLLTLAGISALVDSASVRDFLSNHFGNRRLGDLRKKVVIPTFQLDGKRNGLRTWKAKVFHNTGSTDDPDLNERVVDVLMRSSSPPVVYPIYQGIKERGSGYVDGGLYANNPSMVGLAQALHQVLQSPSTQQTEAPHESGPADMRGLLLLSLGNGFTSTYVSPSFRDGLANWGFARWLLDLRNPLLLVKMMLESGGDAVDYQCRTILRKEYLRLNPVVEKRLVAYNRWQVELALEKVLEMQSTQESLESTLQWLMSSGWLGDSASQSQFEPEAA
ncbi:patatin-like phospholipase family protein [Hyalangium rubrum]|uniref:Patatin-like phospholipase family protein n=1 Tax=Hyalangium rubrum TaxID=3103134 RepID=A0ABU5H9Z4_9BACT|nr:patatin-like phospholipase family protein [Hyalangium sp. s54d21]MDY7229648.1 patatin-like phospholipase family protein [Hyalangium sp. s54d21]